GGKITTYRQVGEEMVDKVYKKQGRTAPPCPTLKKPLPGAILPCDSRIEKAIQDYRAQLPLATIHHLFDIYGAKALEVLALVDEETELGEQITSQTRDIKAQIVYAVKSEYAQTLVDITRRRTSLAMKVNYALDLLPLLTDILTRYCGWSQEKCEKEVQYYRQFMEENCIPDYVMEGSEYTQKVEVNA
ncbi:MAG: glycerol-3-phosphate dehydrogenase C-terminal domain-containing protein, partial [Trichodesmium sp.]